MRILELVTPGARVRIAPELGGAITEFSLRGEPVMRPTPAAAIAARDAGASACYPLVPYSNRIADARLRFDGREFALARNFGTHPHAIHGVGWQRAWAVAEASPLHARLSLDHDGGSGAASWPWSFRATQTFRLTEPAPAGDGAAALLAVTLTIVNTGAAAFPFGLGWHPYFPKAPTTRLGFSADGVWVNDATLLPLRHTALPAEWRFDPPRALGDVALDNVFTGWRGYARIETPSRGTTATLAADRACACLVVYAPPGRDFAAIEPVTHETDAFNRAAAGASGTGMRILPSGAAFSCTMRVAAAAVTGPASPGNLAR